jgi:hypothetical protein
MFYFETLMTLNSRIPRVPTAVGRLRIETHALGNDYEMSMRPVHDTGVLIVNEAEVTNGAAEL